MSDNGKPPFRVGDWLVTKPSGNMIVPKLHRATRNPIRAADHCSGWAYETMTDYGGGPRTTLVDSSYFVPATAQDFLIESARLRTKARALTDEADSFEREASVL